MALGKAQRGGFPIIGSFGLPPRTLLRRMNRLRNSRFPNSAGQMAATSAALPSAVDVTSAAKFFGDLGPAHFKAVGGTREALLKVTAAFYERVFDDPILGVMFRDRSSEHARRLMLFCLSFMEISDDYFKERGSFGTLHARHAASQLIEKRSEAPPGAGCPGGKFTVSQRNAWKGHFVAAFRDVGGLRGGVLQDMADWVDRSMAFYAPFAPDRPPA